MVNNAAMIMREQNLRTVTLLVSSKMLKEQIVES